MVRAAARACSQMETGLAGWGGGIRTSASQNKIRCTRLAQPRDLKFGWLSETLYHQVRPAHL
jgi:hypothetical protein